MSKNQLIKGVSSNNIPYVKWGNGAKIIMIFSGGPGNLLPGKHDVMTKMYDPFLSESTIYMVARKMGLSEGYSTEDIADDYAWMIKNDLGGKVHAVLGESFGGMVMQHFAARHETLSNSFVIMIASRKMSEKGKEVDYNFARLLSEGKSRKAAVKITEALAPAGFGLILLKTLFWFVGSSFVDSSSKTFKSDIRIEAEAELNHDADENLKKIKVPILMICGDSDIYFTLDSIKETANLISNCKLKIYKGKGHMNTLSDKQLIPDIQKFINS